MDTSHPFTHIQATLESNGQDLKYFDMQKLFASRNTENRLPYSIRVLLESAIRNCDNFNIKRKESSDL
jgi:aconitate hydratase